MATRTNTLAAIATLASTLAAGLPALAAPQASTGTWTASWYASPHASWGADFALPTGVPAVLARQTVRETARLSVGGTRVRIVLSNRYGTQPVHVGAARVTRVANATTVARAVPAAHNATAGATAAAAAAVASAPAPAPAASAPAASAPAAAAAAAAGIPLTFGGQTAAIIAPGAPLVSDPVDLPVAALEQLAVSVYLPHATPLATFHWGAQQTGTIEAGDTTAAPPRQARARAQAQAQAQVQILHGRALLAGILVQSDTGRDVVVAFGDSITDGNGSTPDQDRRWPDVLAAAMAQQGVAVVNAGISGARLLGDRMGVNAAARFGPDVLDQPGVATVVVLLGINDIGWPGSAFAPDEPAMTAPRMMAVYRQLIAQARLHKVRIVGATLAPFEGALHGTPFDGYYTPAKDDVRREVNRWILESGEFDAVAGVDAALRDPQHRARLLARFDSGDHLHPGDAGYEAIAAAVAAALGKTD